jgi:hypothetical protein
MDRAAQVRCAAPVMIGAADPDPLPSLLADQELDTSTPR